MSQIKTAHEAVGAIQSGDHIIVHGAAATPQTLLKALVGRADELKNVEIYHIHTEGYSEYAEPQYEGIFHANAFFIGKNIRKAINEGRAHYIPVFLSDIPQLIRKNVIPADVVLLNVSPPDKQGYCSLGVTVVEILAALERARLVIAQINPNMPRTHGDAFVHMSQFNCMVEVDEPIFAVDFHEPAPIDMKIGENISEIVENGATLQMGIGAIPNAALKALRNHKNLGVHTEMFSDGIIELVESGVINNSNKKIHPHKIVSSFVVGSRKLYDFIDDNPSVNMIDCAYTNDTAVIRRNPKVTAINSAIEIDLTGQVCADSIGQRLYSGVGGQMDFIRGAALSEGGKPIIALRSTTSRGQSKIVSMLKPGAGVVTTRAHVRFIVTENGVADLYGKNLRDRAKALIQIAHPDHQEALEREAYRFV